MSSLCIFGRSLTEEAAESDDEIHESILNNSASLKRFEQKIEARAAKGEVKTVEKNISINKLIFSLSNICHSR